MANGNSLGPTGSTLAKTGIQGERVVGEERTEPRQSTAQTMLLRLVDGFWRPCLSCGSYGGGHTSPNSVRVDETRLSWFLQETVRTAHRVMNASVQPFFTSASFHCCVPCKSLRATFHHSLARLASSEIPRWRKDFRANWRR